MLEYRIHAAKASAKGAEAVYWGLTRRPSMTYTRD